MNRWSVLIGIGKRTYFSHAECVRYRYFFEYRARRGRVPSEKNGVIRTIYAHVLNSDGSVSMSVCLFTIAENTFKTMIIPEQKY